MVAKKKTSTKKTVKRNKYRYYQVFQGNYGYGWDDLIYLETNSNGLALSEKENAAFKKDRKLYRQNEKGVRFRTIFRKELN